MIYLKITSLYHFTMMITDADIVLISVLSTVFSCTNHLLCIWHLQKNVLAYIKNKIYTEMMKKNLKQPEHETFMNKAITEMQTDWNKILWASIIEKYEQNWALFQTHYSNWSAIVNYLTNQWISHKKKIVSVWINKILYYSTMITSWIEDFQEVLKHQLSNSTGNLKNVIDWFLLLLKNKNIEH